MHACFRPLLASPAFSQHQGELLARAVKEWLPPALLPALVEAACGGGGSSGPGAAGGGGGPGPPQGSHWNEQLVGLLHTMLAAKPVLSQVCRAGEEACRAAELFSSMAALRAGTPSYGQHGRSPLHWSGHSC